MAKLIPCKECGHQVARKAKTCPSCGVGKPAEKSSLGKLFLVGLVALVPIVIIFGEAGLQAPPSPPPTPEQRAATATARLTNDRQFNLRMYAEQQVQEQLKAPRTAKFSGYGDTVVSPLGGSEDRWVARGWVDAENSFGATLRSRYEVVVEFEENSADRVRLISVDIQ